MTPSKDRQQRGCKLVCSECGLEYEGSNARAEERGHFCPKTGRLAKRIEVPIEK